MENCKEYFLVENGKTEYRILLSDNATESEVFAGQELAYFFEMATGVKLQTVREKDYQNDCKYFSVGDTLLFKNSNIRLSVQELSADGFKLKTDNGNVLMNALGESGKIYAVYEFLRRQFCLRIYAMDEISIDKTTMCVLESFDVTEKPDFDGRDFHNYVFFNDNLFATRMRLNGVRTHFESWQGAGSAWSQLHWCHTTFEILPPDTYWEKHPEWYSENKTQLCFARALEDSGDGKLMFDTFVENLKAFIVAEPKVKFFMVGQEDVGTTCEREISKQANKRYGGENESPSGTLMVFINKVAREIKRWLQETDPLRADIVKLVIFAYQKTQQPPVTYNKETGKYEFVPEVVPEDNVMVRFAPLASVYSKDFMDEEVNKLAKEAILGWSSIGAKMSVWNYTTGFGAYLYPMYNLHTWRTNYRIFKKYGVKDVLDQGPCDTASTPFLTMRNYMGAELLWKVEQDPRALAEEFLKVYFKEAAPYMQKYLELIQAHYKVMEITKGYCGYAGIWESRDTAIPKFYPRAFIEDCLKIFQDAYKAIENIADECTRETVKKRVRIEELSPRYMLLDLYRKFIDKDEQIAMIEAFAKDAEELELRRFREGPTRSIADKTKLWINELN